ncbi:hypothetical protein Sbal625DRAFT_1987 [Shewanella baltica OS625]|uniref:O-antigen polymerase n=1 Tax=Shewanella baltica (strain OS195) TaxID=399599 RepID=A9KVT8_SHEB9|nr:hypothetical protein [Shewanella baltica]ABX50187.1 hypothetical protein Sbal195_3022 [Shewanella baltica OS195]ADT95180.1 hypothetical protein Sbal678_3033 [Shewanella baltica OS678]EHC06309.1 hypothetical protein Sbal625DRAFT_1987 [Shewanella baltica OS625]
MKTLYFIVIVFLYIFSFYVPLAGNSIYIAFLLSVPLYNKRTSFYFLKFTRASFFLSAMILLLMVFSYYAVATVAVGVNDFSLLKIYAGILVYGGIGAFIALVIFSNTEDEFIIHKLLYFCLLIQAFIILLSFANSSIKEFFDIFRTENSIEVANRYYGGGIRGLALSGSQFFGLSVLLSSMTYFCCVLEFQLKNRTWFYVTILFCSIVFLSVGRTAIFGLIFGFLFLVLNFTKNYAFFLKFLVSCASIVAVLIMLYPIIDPAIASKLNNFIAFAFEAVINYMEYGKFHTSSTDVLSNMYYSLPIDTLIHGDVQYTNSDGLYYGDTDAGYMRHVLALGLPMTCILMFSFYIISSYTRFLFDVNNRKVAFGLFFVMLIILHYKGEVFWTLLSETGLVIFLSVYGYAFRMAGLKSNSCTMK